TYLAARAARDQASLQGSRRTGVTITGVSPSPYYPPTASPYPPPYDATAGLRQPHGVPPGLLPTGTIDGAPLTAGVVYNRSTVAGAPTEIFHQPLVQVKVRVVEVARGDQLQVTSVLDAINNP